MQHQSCGPVRLKSARRYFVAVTLIQIVLLGSVGRAFASNEQFDYLQKDFSLTCHGLNTFDFILEAGQLVGEWCREQNARLGDRGCGDTSDLCLDEFVRADRPGYSLSIALGAASTKADVIFFGSDVVFGSSRWVRSSDTNRMSQPTSDYSWSTDLSQKRLQILFGLGVEFPLGARTVIRKTCVNPMASPYVKMLTSKTLQSNLVIQKFTQNCDLAKDF